MGVSKSLNDFLTPFLGATLRKICPWNYHLPQLFCWRAPEKSMTGSKAEANLKELQLAAIS